MRIRIFIATSRRNRWYGASISRAELGFWAAALVGVIAIVWGA